MASQIKQTSSPTHLGQLIARAFNAKGREAYRSRANGVFVKARCPGEFHNFDLVYYGVGPELSPLPRLAINRNFVVVPSKIFRTWKVSYPWSPFKWWTGLEVTFLPEESEVIAGWLTRLTDMIEEGASSDWSKDFPFDLRKITDTNLWTRGADRYATTSLEADRALRQASQKLLPLVR